jgi:hypothetical protein
MIDITVKGPGASTPNGHNPAAADIAVPRETVKSVERLVSENSVSRLLVGFVDPNCGG